MKLKGDEKHWLLPKSTYFKAQCAWKHRTLAKGTKRQISNEFWVMNWTYMCCLRRRLKFSLSELVGVHRLYHWNEEIMLKGKSVSTSPWRVESFGKVCLPDRAHQCEEHVRNLGPRILTKKEKSWMTKALIAGFLRLAWMSTYPSLLIAIGCVWFWFMREREK